MTTDTISIADDEMKARGISPSRMKRRPIMKQTTVALLAAMCRADGPIHIAAEMSAAA